MKELKVDRTIKELLPVLTKQEYLNLEEDIKARGCEVPLDVWSGKDIILDGHNRYEICTKNGIDFKVKERNFETKKEALLWMYNKQLGRRNLSDANRIEIALARDKLIGGNIATKEMSRNERTKIAEEVGVSERTVAKVKVVQDEGTKKTKKAMHEGEISIDKAYKETRKIEDVPKPPPPAASSTKIVLEKPEDYHAVHPDIMPEGYQACHYCKGTGIEKKVERKIINDGKKHCSLCNGTVFDGNKCKTCGMVN